MSALLRYSELHASRQSSIIHSKENQTRVKKIRISNMRFVFDSAAKVHNNNIPFS